MRSANAHGLVIGPVPNARSKAASTLTLSVVISQIQVPMTAPEASATRPRSWSSMSDGASERWGMKVSPLALFNGEHGGRPSSLERRNAVYPSAAAGWRQGLESPE